MESPPFETPATVPVGFDSDGDDREAASMSGGDGIGAAIVDSSSTYSAIEASWYQTETTPDMRQVREREGRSRKDTGYDTPHIPVDAKA